MNINKRHSKLKSWSNKTPNASYTHRYGQFDRSGECAVKEQTLSE